LGYSAKCGKRAIGDRQAWLVNTLVCRRIHLHHVSRSSAGAVFVILHGNRVSKIAISSPLSLAVFVVCGQTTLRHTLHHLHPYCIRSRRQWCHTFPTCSRPTRSQHRDSSEAKTRSNHGTIYSRDLNLADLARARLDITNTALRFQGSNDRPTPAPPPSPLVRAEPIHRAPSL
jgi:hypothetical protein